jgi:poly(A) polymerase
VAWQVLRDEAARWTPPAFPLKGADIVAAGIPPGPDVGAALQRLEEAWIASDFQVTRTELLTRLGEG